MDAEGARALARRIAGGPPSKQEAPASGGGPSEASHVIFGLRIYRTEAQQSVRDGRPVIVRRRVCKTLVEGRWISSVVREDVDRVDPGGEAVDKARVTRGRRYPHSGGS